MNIPELSTALASNKLMSQVGTAVLSKSLDTAEAMGNSMVQMMNTSMSLSVNPAIGSNIDTYV